MAAVVGSHTWGWLYSRPSALDLGILIRKKSKEKPHDFDACPLFDGQPNLFAALFAGLATFHGINDVEGDAEEHEHPIEGPVGGGIVG